MALSPETYFALAWTTSSFIGLSFQSMGLMDAILDLTSLKAHGKNGARLVVGRAHRRNEMLFCSIHFLFLIVGILAFSIHRHQPSRTGEAASLAIVLVNAILVINAILSRRDRHAINRHISRLEGEEPT